MGLLKRVGALVLLVCVLSLCLIPCSFVGASEGSVKVGTYYYVWWGPLPQNRDHWGEGVKYTPLLGEYDSGDPLIAAKHVQWAKQHGVDFFAISWLGKGTWIDWMDWDFDDVDRKFKSGFLNADLSNFSFCLFYETSIVLDTANQKAGKNFTQIFVEDMAYAAENYFPNPSYLRVNGKPVLFIYNLPYLYQNLSDSMKVHELFDDIRRHMDVYLAGDIVSASEPNVNSPLLYSMDAVTSYFFAHPLISQGWQTITEQAEKYYPKWRSEMNSIGIKFVPNAFPGYDNVKNLEFQGKGSQDEVLQLDEPMFKKMLVTALKNVDSDLKIVMITSWNEWLESTAIEPSNELGESLLQTVAAARESSLNVWDIIFLAVVLVFCIVVVTVYIYLKFFRKRLPRQN